jgi:probable rRNA maturation factor
MVRVCFTWERRPAGPVADLIRGVARTVVDRELGRPAEVHVLITGDDRIRGLNRAFRGVEAATDVLSFPDGDVLPDGRTLLGEIVISLDTAREQAARAGHPVARELAELVLHGLLHLLGHDHARDGGTMDALEIELREVCLDD